jgi:hypothetical protein
VLVFQELAAQIGTGARAVAAFLASEYPHPTTPPAAVKPWDACDGFIWVYLPESAVEKFEEAAKEGYAGSNGDFQFTSSEADRGQHLHVRDAPCGVCEHCEEHPVKMSPECVLQKLGYVGAPRQVCIAATAAADPQQPRRRAAAAAMSSLDDFALTIGKAEGGWVNNVIVTKKNADDDVEDEFFDVQDYYLARPVGHAFQSTDAGTIGQTGPVYPAGTWLVKMKWYEMTSFNEHGVRCYQLAKLYPELVWPVASLVRCAGVRFSACDSRNRFSLSLSMHQKIMNFGVFD